jgi:competence ComEA-like helix-hairpin-helix protein
MKRFNPNSILFFIIGTFFGLLISGSLYLIFAKPCFKTIPYTNDPFGLDATPSLLQDNNLCLHSTGSSVTAETKIDSNTASVEELDLLPGIGEVKSRAIIEFRQKYRNFHSINELLYVQGINESLFQKFCDLIVVNP